MSGKVVLFIIYHGKLNNLQIAYLSFPGIQWEKYLVPEYQLCNADVKCIRSKAEQNGFKYQIYRADVEFRSKSNVSSWILTFKPSP